MGAAYIDVDLHGLRRAEAMRKIDEALGKIDSGTYQIRLIHGYNRGTSLASMIREEYRCERRILRIVPGDNPGITIFVIREL